MSKGPLHELKIVIAGAGIAGLTAAVAMQRKGATVSVYERAEELEEAGAGLQLQPSAVRVLNALGLGEPLRAAATIPDRIDFREARTGRLIIRGVPGNAQRETPLYQMHRADLLETLLTAAKSLGIVVHTDAAANHVMQDEGRATLVLEDQRELHADLLIGADGIKSAIRSSLFGEEEPQFTGNVAHRAMIDVSQLKKSFQPGVFMGPNAHFVIYPLRGGRCVNIVAQQHSADWTEEGWTSPGKVEDLRDVYSDWHPDVDALLDAMTETYKWALYTRPPMQSWSKGRVGLIGDACHPALPNLGAGAAMAIEDAYLLAELLSRSPNNVPKSLELFYTMRIKRCTRVQQQSARNAALFHLQQPAARWLCYRSLALITRLSPGIIQRRLRWLQDYDLDSLIAGMNR